MVVTLKSPAPPLHKIALSKIILAINSLGSDTRIEFEITLHPAISVTVQVYDPAHKPIAGLIV